MTRHRLGVVAAAAALALIGAAPAAQAQCQPEWLPGVPGTNGGIYALAALPDGDVIAGGLFTVAGGVPANNIARYSPATNSWAPLGEGFPGENVLVHAVAVLPNGDIVAGGFGPPDVTFVARWDGTQWHPLGEGVLAWSGFPLAVLPNGDIVAGNWPRRWDGAQWADIGFGHCIGCLPAVSLAALPNGQLAAALLQCNGACWGVVLVWDGVSWADLPQPPWEDDDGPLAVAALPDGGIVASTVYNSGVFSWDGNQWLRLGDGVPASRVFSMAVTPEGGVLVVDGEYNHSRLWRWDGLAWSVLGIANGSMPAVAHLSNGNVIVGGWFSTVDGVSAAGFARFGCPPLHPCPADFDGNGTVAVPDIFAFLAAWFGGSPSADIDGNGLIQVPDIFAFLSAWFAGCP